MRVRIDAIVKGALGLARLPSGALLVEGALPGELVDTQALGRRAGAAMARATRVLQPSPLRREAPCPVYGRCGGCDLQHARYEGQLELKRRILEDCLRRIGKIADVPPIACVASPEMGYRRRVRLHVGMEAGRAVIGYYRRRSRDVQSIESCPLLVPKLDDMVRHLASDAKGLLSGLVEVTALEGQDGLSIAARVQPEVEAQPRALRDWLAELPVRELSIHAASPRPSVAGVTIPIGDTMLTASARAFFQGNRPLLPALVSEVMDLPLDLARVHRAWDLYAGVGLFSVILAGRAREIVAVESDPQAVALLRHNLSRRRGARVFEGTELEFLRRAETVPALCVVDPPRAGLPRKAREALAAKAVPRLVIVGCDPASFAQDVGAFARAGYQLERLAMLDLYPQSSHMEAIAHLLQ